MDQPKAFWFKQALLPDGWSDNVRIELDKDGNIAVAYSISSDSMFPGIRYAGRLATDPLGTLPYAEGVIKNGTGTQGSNRYGDYSSLNVDPTDGCTFWVTNMYGIGSSWNTQIATMKFPECGNAPPLDFQIFLPSALKD